MKDSPTPYRLRNVHRLSADNQKALDRLVIEVGYGAASYRLGVAVQTINKLAYGGFASPSAVARAAEALNAMAVARSS
jgi:hypothetical protein